MPRPKKDKYIRDLFEKDFSKKFSYFILNISFEEINIRYKESVIETLNLLKDGKKFITAPTIYFDVIDDNEIYTIKTFNKFLYKINFRGHFYKLIKLKKMFNKIVDKNSFSKDIIIEIDKKLNKSIKNFIKNNADFFILCKPTRNSIVILTIEHILDKVIDFTQRRINTKYKKERTVWDIEKRSTFIYSEYKRIMNLISVFEKIKEDVEKNNVVFGDYTTEDMIKYFVAQYLDLEWQDDDIDFVFRNYEKFLPKKKLSYLYLREKYDCSLNDETLDKSIDRGSKKHEKRNCYNYKYRTIDYYLNKANLQDDKNIEDSLSRVKGELELY